MYFSEDIAEDISVSAGETRIAHARPMKSRRSPTKRSRKQNQLIISGHWQMRYTTAATLQLAVSCVPANTVLTEIFKCVNVPTRQGQALKAYVLTELSTRFGHGDIGKACTL